MRHLRRDPVAVGSESGQVIFADDEECPVRLPIQCFSNFCKELSLLLGVVGRNRQDLFELIEEQHD